MKPSEDPGRPLPEPGVQICCSISGGRTSAYLALRLMELYGKENVKFIFTDTGSEHPATYKFLRDFAMYNRVEIIALRVVVDPQLGNGNSYKQVPLEDCRFDLQPWKDVVAKYGLPYLHGAFCTRTLKLEVYNRYCRNAFGRGKYHTFLGIRSDEPTRLRNKPQMSYLADIDDIEKPDILAFWKTQEFDLGIPEHLGNCVFCIKKRPNKLALAARDEPHLVQHFIDVLESDDVRVTNRGKPSLIMYRGDMTLRNIVDAYADHTRDEIAATIRGYKGEDTGSCTESCEAMLDESEPLFCETDNEDTDNETL